MKDERIGTETLKSGPKENSDYLIVEIGSGKYPLPLDVPESYREWMNKNPSIRYVGVDINFGKLQQGRASQENKDREHGIPAHERVSYVKATGTELPFANNAVSELVLKNVLGDPGIWVAIKMLILQEASRVLKPSGLLKIIEQETPDVAREEDLRRFIIEMRNHAFTLESPSIRRPPHEKDFDPHMHESHDARPSSFILRLRKNIPAIES